MNFKEAKELFETAKNQSIGKPLENNTRLIKTAKGYGIKLHNTIIVEMLPNNTYVLNTGGWQTVTTKDRINKYSPACLIQTKNIWYIGKFIYEDGMRVNSKGLPTNIQKRLKRAEILERKNKKLDSVLSKYIKGFTEIVKAGKLEDPSGGDCWCCCGMTSGKSDVSHLMSHFKESYFVPRLLWNAITEAGYTDPSIIWHLIKNQKDPYYLKLSLRRYFKARRSFLLKAI